MCLKSKVRGTFVKFFDLFVDGGGQEMEVRETLVREFVNCQETLVFISLSLLRPKEKLDGIRHSLFFFWDSLYYLRCSDTNSTK